MNEPITTARALAYGRAKIAGLSVAGLVVVILLVAWALKSCEAPDHPKIPPQDQTTLDSLKRTDSSFHRQQDSIITIIIHDTVKANAVNASAEKSKANAAVIGRQADSLAKLAEVAKTAADSAREYHNAFDARTRERDTLLVTIVKKDSTLRVERAVASGWRDLYVADTARRVATEDINRRLQRDIARLDTPCRIVGPIPCPSRTVVGVVSAVAGVLAGRATKP